MKNITLVLIALGLVACKGNATQASQNAERQNTVVEQTSAIPTGVQVLQPDETYNVDQAPGHLVVIDFNAVWCAPCLRFMPIFEQAAEKYHGKVEFISVNVDQHQELVQQLGISSIPFIVFIQPDGKLNTWVGFLPETEFYKAIDQFLAQK